MNIIHIVGARPNFMKAAPVYKALQAKDSIHQITVHTGQHYDINMSDIFFTQLSLPAPAINLEAGSGSHAIQTAQVMMRLEPVVLDRKPDLVLVYGDVNSTVAAALVCAKLGITVGHVEAGLRSFDRSMPEEINRLLTDQIADLLFTPSEDADKNLLREGIGKEKIYRVGNVMIDTLVQLLPAAEALWPDLSLRWGITNKQYALVTIHRPSNVDNMELLANIIKTLAELSEIIPVIFPIHPRTLQRMKEADLEIQKYKHFHLTEPIGYLDFLCLQHHAKLVITDSGGIQEETTFLGIPCLTIRENTERPVTMEIGTNIVIGQDIVRLKNEVYKILDGKAKKGRIPPLWDGKASERIADIIVKEMGTWNLRI
jgi:UDP-N-acetylglucosamine 2-epimerase (non-hydrolysing)